MTAGRPGLAPLKNALARLAEALELLDSDPARSDPRLYPHLQAGAIKWFESAYELCWRMAERWLDANVTPGVAQGAARRQLYRLAADRGLIHDVDAWMRYHEARNETVHVHDGAKAAEVHRVAGEFVPDARALLAALEAAP